MSIGAKKIPLTICNKATQPFLINEKMFIEPDNMGLVIGHNGCSLNRLKEIYGVHVRLPIKGGSQIILEGPIEMVSAAKKDIEQNQMCKTSFFIEKDYISLVIGREGKAKGDLEDALNVRISIKVDREVVVCSRKEWFQ